MREKGSLAGATAIVTGASSRIGYGIASRPAVDGAAVAINYHSQHGPAEQLRGEIERGGGRAIVVGEDVSKEADVASLFDRTVEAFGRVDILVANAGAQKDAGIVDMTLDDWREVIELDLTGQFLCCREAVRRFRAHRSAVLKGGDQLDASLLMMPLVRFVSATDPVWLKTLDDRRIPYATTA
jgi:glucose 1-dehydrogenase